MRQDSFKQLKSESIALEELRGQVLALNLLKNRLSQAKKNGLLKLESKTDKDEQFKKRCRARSNCTFIFWHYFRLAQNSWCLWITGVIPELSVFAQKFREWRASCRYQSPLETQEYKVLYSSTHLSKHFFSRLQICSELKADELADVSPSIMYWMQI